MGSYQVPDNITANIGRRARTTDTQPRVLFPSVFLEETRGTRAIAIKRHGRTLTNYWPLRH